MIVQSISNALACDQSLPVERRPASGDVVILSSFAGAPRNCQTLPAVDALPGSESHNDLLG